MKKTLYSLMLSDDVVREIDTLAHRQGVNRSALVDRVLAEYAGLMTPERRISDIFRQIGEILGSDRELVPFVAPGGQSMSMKSSLQYRYRPTVKYSVELYRGGTEAAGELSVIFRTQSVELLAAMDAFFRLWKQVEDELAAPGMPSAPEYALYSGRFTRSLRLAAGRDYSTADIAAAISAYVRLFDRLMKGYLAETLTPAQVRAEYAAWLRRGNAPL